MRLRSWQGVCAVLIGAVLVLGACSSDDGGGDDASGSTTPDAPTSSCAGTDVTFEGPGTESFEAVSAYAVKLVDGGAYTVYVADEEIDTDSIGTFSNPEPSAEGTIITVAATVFNPEGDVPPIEVGTVIPYTDEFGVLTFRVTSQVGEELNGNNLGAVGDLTVTGVDDNFCATVEYEDGEKTMSGTIEAEIIEI